MEMKNSANMRYFILHSSLKNIVAQFHGVCQKKNLALCQAIILCPGRATFTSI